MSNTLAEGQVLAGKYRVERVLGRGGMGVVVAAHHIHLDERVAIKFLLPEALVNAEATQRFVREARAAVRIKSEHVARVSDVGMLEGGEPYMVMEYLEGSDLADTLRERGALPVEQAVEFVLQASEAIAEAHVLGIVHRDLKPANLFVVRRADGVASVKVLDFGISKVSGPASDGEAHLTRTSAVMGSPLYMPPEQMAASRNVDPRADIWALGAILYELLCCRAAFLGESLPEVCLKIATLPPPPMRDFRADLQPGLEAVVLRCLEKDRERRYDNIAQLAHALLEFAPKRARSSVARISRTFEAAGLGPSSAELEAPHSPRPAHSAAAPAATAAATADSPTAAPWERSAAKPGSGSRAVPAVLAFVGVVGLAAAYMHFRGSPELPVSAVAPTSSVPLAASVPSVTPAAPVVAPVVAPAAPAVAPAVVNSAASASAKPAGASPPNAALRPVAAAARKPATAAVVTPHAAAAPAAPRADTGKNIFEDRN